MMLLVAMVAVFLRMAAMSAAGFKCGDLEKNLFKEIEECKDDSLDIFRSSWSAGTFKLKFARSRWVPQGMAYYREKDWLLVTYYDKDDELPSQIEVIKRSTFRFVKHIKVPEKLVPPGGHVGGIAVGRERLWVTSTAATSTDNNTHCFPVSEVVKAKNGGTLGKARSFLLKASSYASFHSGSLFVGSFDTNKLYKYAITPTANIDLKPSEHDTPSLVQGLAVTDDAFVFSRSCGRTRLGVKLRCISLLF
jgi:hypothetical protein